MKREDIIRMARESCDKDKVDAWQNGFWVITQEELERFASLVIEECAKSIDEEPRYAAAIRARKQS